VECRRREIVEGGGAGRRVGGGIGIHLIVSLALVAVPAVRTEVTAEKKNRGGKKKEDLMD
jgi:hypothetical protein